MTVLVGVIAVTLLYIAAINTVVAFAVCRDALRAVSYRSDAMKLWAGIWAARSGRQPVFTRRDREQTREADQQVGDLSHDLMVRAGSDVPVA